MCLYRRMVEQCRTKAEEFAERRSGEQWHVDLAGRFRMQRHGLSFVGVPMPDLDGACIASDDLGRGPRNFLQERSLFRGGYRCLADAKQRGPGPQQSTAAIELARIRQ